jgi:hypothetical protein
LPKRLIRVLSHRRHQAIRRNSGYVPVIPMVGATLPP